MRAPDKIYIYREPPKDHFEDEWGESEVNDMESIPYIRKDALLEWAKGMMDCFATGGDCSQTLQMVIKHIESL